MLISNSSQSYATHLSSRPLPLRDQQHDVDDVQRDDARWSPVPANDCSTSDADDAGDDGWGIWSRQRPDVGPACSVVPGFVPVPEPDDEAAILPNGTGTPAFVETVWLEPARIHRKRWSRSRAATERTDRLQAPGPSSVPTRRLLSLLREREINPLASIVDQARSPGEEEITSAPESCVYQKERRGIARCLESLSVSDLNVCLHLPF